MSVSIGYAFWDSPAATLLPTSPGGAELFPAALTVSGHRLTPVPPGRMPPDHLVPIEILLLEWRPPDPDHTPCDPGQPLCNACHQEDLLQRYTEQLTPTVLWDTASALPRKHSLHHRPHVIVCNQTRYSGMRRLLVPLQTDLLRAANPEALARRSRPLVFAHADDPAHCQTAFNRYLAPAAVQHNHAIASTPPNPNPWEHANFIGVEHHPSELYGMALAAVLLPNDRGDNAMDLTRQLFAAVLAGAVPMVPAASALQQFVPAHLLIFDGRDTHTQLKWLIRIAGTTEHVDLIAGCLGMLHKFQLSRQLKTLQKVIDQLIRDQLERKAHASVVSSAFR